MFMNICSIIDILELHRWKSANQLWECMDRIYSPTLYSQITGKYASVESKIFPHILLLCSISYSCFNGLTINQHFIKPLESVQKRAFKIITGGIVRTPTNYLYNEIGLEALKTRSDRNVLLFFLFFLFSLK